MEGGELQRAVALVEEETGGTVESARIVEQMTTSEGNALVFVVETEAREYWVVEDDTGEDYYPRHEFQCADDALDAYVEATVP